MRYFVISVPLDDDGSDLRVVADVDSDIDQIDIVRTIASTLDPLHHPDSRCIIAREVE